MGGAESPTAKFKLRQIRLETPDDTRIQLPCGCVNQEHRLCSRQVSSAEEGECKSSRQLEGLYQANQEPCAPVICSYVTSFSSFYMKKEHRTYLRSCVVQSRRSSAWPCVFAMQVSPSHQQPHTAPGKQTTRTKLALDSCSWLQFAKVKVACIGATVMIYFEL